jgi:septum formation protein
MKYAELILASASTGRAAILRGAKLPFRQESANVDERVLEAEAVAASDTGRVDAGGLALLLAAAKAREVSARFPAALVLGADQVMECEGIQYQKPPAMAAARQQLQALRGRTHTLHSALCVAREDRVLWQHLDRAHLTMRAFSDAFLDDYCRTEGAIILQPVGSYRIEGRGIQLFSTIEGDHFTIIGLPLLPLLGYLRDIEWLPR